MKTVYFMTAVSFSVAVGAAMLHPGSGDPTDADPVVTDPVVQSAKESMANSSTGHQVAVVDWLIGISPSLSSASSAQALYTAGHKAYSLGDSGRAATAFEDLLEISSGTPLEVDALRMLAQIELAVGSIEQAYSKYEQALAALDGLQSIDDLDRQVLMLSFLPSMAILAESLGETASAQLFSERVVTEIPVELHPAVRADGLRLAARTSLALGELAAAKTYAEDYLSSFPQDGFTNGARIEMQLLSLRADGMVWGSCLGEELQFVSDLLDNNEYDADPARYDYGSYLVMCLISNKHTDVAEALILTLLDEVQVHVIPLPSGELPSRYSVFKEVGEGQLRFNYAMLLSQLGKEAEARAQVDILRADAGFGVYASTTYDQVGVALTPVDP